MDILLNSKYKNNYRRIIFKEEKKYFNTFTAINRNGKNVFLKVYKKEEIEKGPKDFIYKQIEREKDLIQKCRNFELNEKPTNEVRDLEKVKKRKNQKEDMAWPEKEEGEQSNMSEKSKNIVELYDKIGNEDDNIIILEYERCFMSLAKYINEYNRLSFNLNFFIKIIRSMANILQVLKKQNIIHRDIKPYNIFIQKIDYSDDDIEDNCIIKLSDFGSSIEIEKNDSKQIGTILYSAPEIIKNLKYDEKIDIWSLGITLYHLYFGFTPYTTEYDLESIQDKIYSNNLIYKFTNIPTLDILFKKLLEINPEERMTHEEFIEYVNSEEFMKPDKIYKKEKYGKIYDEIKRIMETNEYKELKMAPRYVFEGKEEEKRLQELINRITKMKSIPNMLDIHMSLEKDEKFTQDKDWINIIYYNEDIIDQNKDNNDIKIFEEETSGAFIFCNNIHKFEIIMNEITKDICKFSLIINGNSLDNIICFLKDKSNFEDYIKNICIYSTDVDKYIPYKKKYKKIKGVFSKNEEVVKFINEKKSKKIIPFPITKLITYDKYKTKLIYFYSHLIISSFYNDLNPQIYSEYIGKIEELINKDKNIIKDNKNKIIESFKQFESFDINQKLDELNQNIIKEYTENTFYGDLNRWLRQINILKFEEVAYFASRLMFSLNTYGNNYKKFYNHNKILYRGIELAYSSLLAYERAKDEKIIFTAFTSTTESQDKAKNFGRFGMEKNEGSNFSVLFYINNLYENNWISNGIDIHNFSKYKNEIEILYQPFSFYIITDVKIDINRREAEIYLKTIGKKEILEEEIKKGKIIEYNEKENIVESK